MGGCFSKEPTTTSAAAAANTSLNQPLLGGDSERSDVIPVQPVRSPEKQAELDNRRKEREERAAQFAKLREQNAADVAAGKAERAANSAKRREEGAANVAASKAKQAEFSKQVRADLQERKAERAAKQSATFATLN